MIYALHIFFMTGQAMHIHYISFSVPECTAKTVNMLSNFSGKGYSYRKLTETIKRVSRFPRAGLLKKTCEKQGNHDPPPH